MEQKENLFVAARRASGKTQKEAAQIAGMGVGTYSDREKDPEEFRLRELKNLHKSYGREAKTVLKRAVDIIFLDS